MTTVRLSEGTIVREVRIEPEAAQLDGRPVIFQRVERDGRLAGVRIDGKEHAVVSVADGSRIFVWCDGVARTFERDSSSRAAASKEPGDLLSPMPGRVRRVLVESGQRVARGDVVLVLEAMKMEHAIRAPKDGVVRLRVREGDLVETGVELARME